MSKILLDLKGYQITDTGEVLFKYEALFDMFRANQTVEGMVSLDHEEIRLYNQRHPDGAIEIRGVTGEPEMPSVRSFQFDIPKQYLDIDLDEYLAERLISMFPDPLEVYVERLAIELDMMEERHMDDFLRTLIYMSDVFEANNVVHGIGRGSACASLVLYLIGIHMVDPLEYDIPIGEFLR